MVHFHRQLKSGREKVGPVHLAHLYFHWGEAYSETTKHKSSIVRNIVLVIRETDWKSIYGADH